MINNIKIYGNGTKFNWECKDNTRCRHESQTCLNYYYTTNYQRECLNCRSFGHDQLCCPFPVYCQLCQTYTHNGSQCKLNKFI